MKPLLSVFCFAALAFSFSAVRGQERTRVLIATTYGEMTVELYNETPLHRDNFIRLTREGYYDSLLIHRVIKGFGIQSGAADTELDDLETENKYTFSDEQRRVYKTIGGAPHLDGSYTVFGEVTSGMAIVDHISNVKIDNNWRPLEDIRMKKDYDN